MTWLARVSTKPIFFSSTRRRASILLSGSSWSMRVFCVIYAFTFHQNSSEFYQVPGMKPTNLTWCASFAYSQRTSASSDVKFGCNSYGFSVRISLAPDGLVMVWKERRLLLNTSLMPSSLVFTLTRLLVVSYTSGRTRFRHSSNHPRNSAHDKRVQSHSDHERVHNTCILHH